MVISVESSFAIFRLPREIIDMITDFLFNDKIALANMSLVCKAFLPSARLHLFETLTIATDRFCLHSASISEIVDTFSSFAPLVHHIQFRDEEDEYKFEKWIAVFLPCFSLFKGVKSLTLPNFDWRNPIEVRNKLFACFSGISELFIVDGYFPDTADIVWLALQFPLLERLDVEYNEEPDHIVNLIAVPTDVRAFPSLRSLAVGGYIGPIICCLLSLERIPSLHTLCLFSVSSSESAAIDRLIRALAPTLKHLTLKFSGFPPSRSASPSQSYNTI
jgi:hypothetical protein